MGATNGRAHGHHGRRHPRVLGSARAGHHPPRRRLRRPGTRRRPERLGRPRQRAEPAPGGPALRGRRAGHVARRGPARHPLVASLQQPGARDAAAPRRQRARAGQVPRLRGARPLHGRVGRPRRRPDGAGGLDAHRRTPHRAGVRHARTCRAGRPPPGPRHREGRRGRRGGGRGGRRPGPPLRHARRRRSPPAPRRRPQGRRGLGRVGGRRPSRGRAGYRDGARPLPGRRDAPAGRTAAPGPRQRKSAPRRPYRCRSRGTS